MKDLLKKIFLFTAAAFVLFGGISVGEAAPVFSFSNTDLSAILKDGLFSAFSTDTRFFKIDVGMCSGGLLLDCYVSSEFGWRNHPIYRGTHFHTGIDLGTYKGAPVIAPADGVVSKIAHSGGYGKFVDVDHGYAWGTKYAHLSKVYVKEGEYIRKGEVIGAVGSTGVSTGPHLHFEMVYFGAEVNPEYYFASLYHIGSPVITFANR